jgi:hypothetical protein
MGFFQRTAESSCPSILTFRRSSAERAVVLFSLSISAFRFELKQDAASSAVSH